jgi:hypothetical protein
MRLRSCIATFVSGSEGSRKRPPKEEQRPTKATIPRIQEGRMSKTFLHNNQPREVIVMFEPHRLQQNLLQTAYSLLVPLPRRPLSVKPPSSVSSSIKPLSGPKRRS